MRRCSGNRSQQIEDESNVTKVVVGTSNGFGINDAQSLPVESEQKTQTDVSNIGILQSDRDMAQDLNTETEQALQDSNRE